MKSKILLFLPLMLLQAAISVKAQRPVYPKPNGSDQIPFGKKLPPPDLAEHLPASLPQKIQPVTTAFMRSSHRPDINAIKKNLDNLKQQLKDKRNEQTLHLQRNSADASRRPGRSHSSDFHLTRDINALAESNPANRSDLYVNRSYAILHQVMYFAADDGIHGSELWRSDGTAAGTFIVKDIEPGTASSDPYEITEANGKLYFSANTSAYGSEPWVSDGTESGTQLLLDINPAFGSSASEFVSMGKKVYFAANANDYLDALWETDGTTAGTKLVKSLGIDPGGFAITQPVTSNGLLFFTFISYTTGGVELWRSDGTESGTYHIGTNAVFYNFPVRLTSYNNKLYFSADDGTGSKLWLTDGTDAGTTLAPGNNDILIDPNENFGITFTVVDNVLYMPASSPGSGNGLYKYDASNTDGITLVKDLTAGSDPDFIAFSEMEVVNNTIYFKVYGYNGGFHDELWSSQGTEASTQLIYKFLPGETISNLCNGNGTLYFVKHDNIFGTELWSISNGFPTLVRDIFKGDGGSYPNFLTAFKGKLFFTAANEQKGNELFMTNGSGIVYGAPLVKDINTVSTSGSYAGYYTNTITPLGGNVVFSAFERVHGYELYGSNGKANKTILLNDIIPGEKQSFPYQFLSKNDAAWFIASTSDTTFSIFKTNGKKHGLKKVVPDYHIYPGYFISDFKVADNNLVFYVLYNYTTGVYELWRSNGTAAGTLLLSSTVYFAHSLNIIGNTAFFVAGDAINGYELWKSDGNVAGTKMVKDINPGAGSSSPKGMVIYKNEVYFIANNGAGPSFWKSDGTKAGTIQLRVIDPWYTTSVTSTERYYFEISNNILYFSAIDYANSKGTQLWKTNGTVAGTQAVKDVSPDADSFYPLPFYFKDVNGTLFFIGDDGVHGAELWKTDGTETGTKIVKDITPGIDPSILGNLTDFAGKLFFTNDGILWSSDGTADGTIPVDDLVISKVQVSNIVVTSKKLFLSGYTYKYGMELYAGKVDQRGKFALSRPANENTIETAGPFNVVLYPNPVKSNATLQITGHTKKVSLSITDMSGRKLWESTISNARFVNLPTAKFATGTYLVTITSDIGSKTIKLVKL